RKRSQTSSRVAAARETLGELGMSRSVYMILSVLLSVAAAQAQAQPNACQIKVVTPQQGDRVGGEGRVRGTAKIPSETHLWVLSHLKDLTDDWWPQGGRPASINPDTGEWVVIVAYGRPKDINELFEVAVVVVNSDTNTHLRG